MRNVSGLLLSLLLVTPAACSKADFGSGGARKQGAVVPSGGQVNPPKDPLDVSQLPGNDGSSGPKAGIGEELSRVIELDCDNQQGVVVEVNPIKGEEAPLVDPSTKGEESIVGLPIGKDINVDKDGQPIGSDGDEGSKGEVGGIDPVTGKPKPQLPSDPAIDVPETAKVVTTVRGKFCPTASKKLTVLFVVDFSGSMGRHVPAPGQPEVAGNDPQVNGSCGRLRAAEAILGKIASEMRDGDIVQVGMVPFAGGIVTNRVLDIRALAEFRAALSKDTFCQYIVQDSTFKYDPINPGGLDGATSGVDASTNYRAAFTAARSALSGIYGRNVVYFISDGEPTSGGTDPVQAGITAGEELRASVANLTLNALLLGDTDPAAQSVLERVAGSPDRVRRADNADQLAAQILDFPLASIDEQSGKATLTVAPYPLADLGLRYLSPSPTEAGVWVYETQPFVLLGVPGEEVVNLVEVTARGSDGSTHSSTVRILYRQ